MARDEHILTGEGLALFKLGDLRDWHQLVARCSLCQRTMPIDHEELCRRFDPSIPLLALQRHLRCRPCSKRGIYATFELHKLLR